MIALVWGCVIRIFYRFSPQTASELCLDFRQSFRIPNCSAIEFQNQFARRAIGERFFSPFHSRMLSSSVGKIH